AGTLAAPSASGQLEVPQLALSESRPSCDDSRKRTLTFRAVRLSVAIDGGMVSIRPFTTELRDGSLSSVVALELRDGGVLHLRETTVRALPLAPVLVDYLCQGYAVTGPLDLVANLSTRPSSFLASLSGEGRFRIGPGQVVGSQALSALGVLRRVGQAAFGPGERIGGVPLDFDSISATYVIDGGRARTRDFTYVSRLMKLMASGEYGLVDGRLNLDVLVT